MCNNLVLLELPVEETKKSNSGQLYAVRHWSSRRPPQELEEVYGHERGQHQTKSQLLIPSPHRINDTRVDWHKRNRNERQPTTFSSCLGKPIPQQMKLRR